MFKVKTKEERIRKKEEEVKVTNLQVYSSQIGGQYLLKGAVASVSVIAITMGISIARNIFGIEPTIMAGTGLGNVINETYNTIGNLFSSPFSPIIYGGAIPLICVATQSRYDTKVDKMERLKYFMENKDAINSVAEEEITILDAKHLSWEKLEDYVEKGRSKVLR